MSHILFVQSQTFAYPGLYYICGALRTAGHTYKILISENSFLVKKYISTHKPAVVGFPCMTGMHRKILEIAKGIKQDFPECLTLLGGIHPTLYPEIIDDPNVDILCRGEGEKAVVELLDSIDLGNLNYSIENLSFKIGNQIKHNPMRPLINPMDSLPFPDYSIYQDMDVLSADTFPMVYMARGCPFSCSYCHNSSQRTLYKGLGKYVRTFGVKRILDEVEAALKCYPQARAVMLGSDTLGTDLDFLTDLLTGFHRRFRIPYTCLIRPEFINEKLAKLLKKTKCHMIAFGIESGSERVRRELLNRKYTNADIINSATILKKYNIRFRTYNIIGFPSETHAEMLATLKLNLKIKPDFPWISIFTPYPGTRLAEFSINRGYLAKDFNYDHVPTSFFNDTLLKNVDRNFILNFHSLFQALVLWPFLYPVLKRFLTVKHNKLFRFVFKTVYAYTCIRSENRSVASFLGLALANRKLFR